MDFIYKLRMLLGKLTHCANFGTDGKPVQCTFDRYLDWEKIWIFRAKLEQKSKNPTFQQIRMHRLKYWMFSALRASTTKSKRHDFQKFHKNLPKIPRVTIFFHFFKKKFPAIISVPFPQTWRRKIRLSFLF